MEKPSIGRIVHYVLRPSELLSPVTKIPHRPAIITQMENAENSINITVFLDPKYDQTNEPIKHLTGIEYSAEKTPGTWHWASRE